MCTVCAPYAGKWVSSVLVACTRTFLPLTSSTECTSCLLYMFRALHLVLDEGAKLGGDRRVGQRLLQVRLVAEQEVEREHAGLRRQRRRVRGRRDHEVDVAGAQ